MKTGRIVLITGAAGGMGAEFVRRFLDNGDMVIATDTGQDALAALSSKLANARLHIRSADVTEEDETKALAAFAQEKGGRIDILVNVAGFFPVQPFLEMTAGDWRRIIDINLTGTALMCKAVLPAMTGRGWGRIINIGSASIYSGVKGQAHYVAAKAGTIGLSRSLAREFGGEGITVASGDFFLPSGRVDFPVPRALDIAEIPGIVANFARATSNARDAGFDGVELHGANGYLHDQFLQDGSNKRTDAYGGSAENRARLMIETAQAMIRAWGADHVGVRLSPSSFLYGVDDSNKRETFGTVIDKLNALGIAYLTLLEPNAKDAEKGVRIPRVAEAFRSKVTVPLIVNTGFDKAKGNRIIADGTADAVAFGVPYIANPDLVERLRTDAPLNKPDPSTFYGEGAKGYTDYPVFAEAEPA